MTILPVSLPLGPPFFKCILGSSGEAEIAKRIELLSSRVLVEAVNLPTCGSQFSVF